MFRSGQPGRSLVIHQKPGFVEPARGLDGGNLFKMSKAQLLLQKRVDLVGATRHSAILDQFCARPGDVASLQR
jgi:hypothetical protein